MGKDIEIVRKFLIDRERRRLQEINRCYVFRTMFEYAQKFEPETVVENHY